MSIFRWSLTWFVREKERCNCFVLPDIFAVTYGLLAEQQGWCYSKVWNEVIVNWSWKLINKRETFFICEEYIFFNLSCQTNPAIVSIKAIGVYSHASSDLLSFQIAGLWGVWLPWNEQHLLYPCIPSLHG